MIRHLLVTDNQYRVIAKALRHIGNIECHRDLNKREYRDVADLNAAMAAGNSLPWARVDLTNAPNATYITDNPTFEG